MVRMRTGVCSRSSSGERMKQNIELFNQYVARILAQLYESFPVKQHLDVYKLTGLSAEDPDPREVIHAPDGSKLKEAQVAASTIDWLVETGYIRADDRGYPCEYLGCVLTAKGLKLLQAVPDSVNTTETAGAELVRLLKGGSIDVAINFAKEILMRGAAGAM